MSLAEVLQVACQNFDVYSFILKGGKKKKDGGGAKSRSSLANRMAGVWEVGDHLPPRLVTPRSAHGQGEGLAHAEETFVLWTWAWGASGVRLLGRVAGTCIPKQES